MVYHYLLHISVPLRVGAREGSVVGTRKKQIGTEDLDLNPRPHAKGVGFPEMCYWVLCWPTKGIGPALHKNTGLLRGAQLSSGYGPVWWVITKQNSYSISHLLGTVTTHWTGIV